MIRLNQPAPDFSGVTTRGDTFRLSALRGRVVVLFFFPKAFTPGWTKEASQFRDASEEMRALGAEVVGISTDDHKTQCDFAASLALDYPMISDASGEIAHAFDVMWPFFKRARRITFVIDEAGQVRAVFQHEIRIGQHADEAVAAVRRLRHGSRTTATGLKANEN